MYINFVLFSFYCLQPDPGNRRAPLDHSPRRYRRLPVPHASHQLLGDQFLRDDNNTPLHSTFDHINRPIQCYSEEPNHSRIEDSHE